MKMKKLVVVLAACAVLPVTAFADMFTFDSQLTPAAGDYTLTTKVPGATVYDFTSLTPSIAGNYALVTGSLANRYAAPFSVTENTADATRYLTVPQNLSASPVSATISFGQDYNYLGFFWGSIDNYNTITFYNDGAQVASYTGDDFINPDNLTGNQTAVETNKYVNFFMTNSFDAIKLTSTSYAFELDNLAVSVVPVPGAVLLGFLGLGAAGMRLRKRV